MLPIHTERGKTAHDSVTQTAACCEPRPIREYATRHAHENDSLKIQPPRLCKSACCNQKQDRRYGYTELVREYREENHRVGERQSLDNRH